MGLRALFKVLALGLAVAAATTAATTRPVRAQEIPAGTKVPVPEFQSGLKWLNSKPLTLSDLRGKVVLVDFWEYTCVNCIRTLPYLRAWHKKYQDKGLVIIGVHTPEFQFAKQHENVVRAAKQFELTYPIVVDSGYDIWNAYGNRFWPAKYLIDGDGNLRYVHFGEGSYGATEQQIQRLLRETNPALVLPPITEPIRGTDKPGARCYPVTPELYVGEERGSETLGNAEGYRQGQTVNYGPPAGLWRDGSVYMFGPWMNSPQAMISTRENSAPRDFVGIRYHALEVNAVIKPEEGKPARLWLLHDGKPVAEKDRGDDVKYDEQGRSYVQIDEPRMYHLVKNAKFGQRTLKLCPADPGVGIYSFTFVSCEVGQR
jgi:thiol-disulfide isomerase/thioredoxin